MPLALVGEREFFGRECQALKTLKKLKTRARALRAVDNPKNAYMTKSCKGARWVKPR